MIPIVANNPAFKVAIVSVDGALEEKPRAKSDAAQQDAIKIGDYIFGEELSDTREKGKEAAGKVLVVLQSGQEVSGYKVLDKNGKEVIIDPTTAVRDNHNGQMDDVVETHVLSYENWLVESKLNESGKYQIEIIYDKPFDTTTIQGASPDGFKGITVKGNFETQWKGKYLDIDAAIRNIEKGLHKYDILQVQK
jgi:hypothetical protein